MAGHVYFCAANKNTLELQKIQKYKNSWNSPQQTQRSSDTNKLTDWN